MPFLKACRPAAILASAAARRTVTGSIFFPFRDKRFGGLRLELSPYNEHQHLQSSSLQ